MAYLRSPAVLLVIAFLSLWLSVWSLAVAGLLAGSFSAWKEVLTSRTNSGSLIGKALVFTLFSVPFLAAECFAIFALSNSLHCRWRCFSLSALRCTSCFILY